MRRHILPIVVLLMTAGLSAQESGSGGTYQPLSGVQRQTGTGSDGLLTSSFHVSEILNFFSQPNNSSQSGQNSLSNYRADTSVGGNFGYAMRTDGTDLRFHYSGGALFYNTPLYSSQNSQTGSHPINHNSSYHQLDIDDSIQLKRFVITWGDLFHYSPSQYSLGGAIPGIPGIGGQTGGLGFNNPGLLPGTSPLTEGTTVLSNATFAQLDYQLNKRTTLTGTGAYGISRIPDFKLYDVNQTTVQAGVDYRFTGRTSMALTVDRSHSKYLGLPLTTDITFGSVSVSHVFTRAFDVSASFGPQYRESTGLQGRFSFTGHALASYVKGRDHYHAFYSRRTTTGALSQFGQDTDDLGAGWNRAMSRNWNLSVQAALLHGKNIRTSRTTNSQQFGIQADRHLLQNVSGYVSYTFRHQSSSSALAAPVLFSGKSNTVGFGLTYTPRALRLKR